MNRPLSRRLLSDRAEAVAYVGTLLRSDELTDNDYYLAMALMTRYAITAAELNR